MRVSGLPVRTMRTVAMWLLLAPSLAAAAPLRLEFDGTGILVSPVTPLGEVVLFGSSHTVDADEGVLLIANRIEQLRDDDGDGRVRLELGAPVPKLSVWAAVELTSGEIAVEAPPGSRLQRVNWRGRGPVTNRSDQRDAIADTRSYALLMLARPGKDALAWQTTIGDGTLKDADGAVDGQFELVLDDLEAVRGNSAPPSRFAPKDVVLQIDPNSLEITLVTVGEVVP